MNPHFHGDWSIANRAVGTKSQVGISPFDPRNWPTRTFLPACHREIIIQHPPTIAFWTVGILDIGKQLLGYDLFSSFSTQHVCLDLRRPCPRRHIQVTFGPLRHGRCGLWAVRFPARLCMLQPASARDGCQKVLQKKATWVFAVLHDRQLDL